LTIVIGIVGPLPLSLKKKINVSPSSFAARKAAFTRPTVSSIPGIIAASVRRCEFGDLRKRLQVFSMGTSSRHTFVISFRTAF
jgi:hypothetical protein